MIWGLLLGVPSCSGISAFGAAASASPMYRLNVARKADHVRHLAREPTVATVWSARVLPASPGAASNTKCSSRGKNQAPESSKASMLLNMQHVHEDRSLISGSFSTTHPSRRKYSARTSSVGDCIPCSRPGNSTWDTSGKCVSIFRIANVEHAVVNNREPLPGCEFFAPFVNGGESTVAFLVFGFFGEIVSRTKTSERSTLLRVSLRRENRPQTASNNGPLVSVLAKLKSGNSVWSSPVFVRGDTILLGLANSSLETLIRSCASRASVTCSASLEMETTLASSTTFEGC
ncbi:hypothetical protein KC345_g137 [Hortaea werneckii]|nr:hypothetical protein KC345_g137 [Hortaea werneckii]